MGPCSAAECLTVFVSAGSVSGKIRPMWIFQKKVLKTNPPGSSAPLLHLDFPWFPSQRLTLFCFQASGEVDLVITLSFNTVCTDTPRRKHAFSVNRVAEIGQRFTWPSMTYFSFSLHDPYLLTHPTPHPLPPPTTYAQPSQR